MTEPEQEQKPTPSSASELTIAEAARATGASERTLRRKLHADALPGARMVEGRWLIPATALVAAGYTLTSEPAPAPEPSSDEPAAADWLLERAELEQRAKLAEQRAQAAEALALERLDRAQRAEASAERAEVIAANLTQTVRQLTAAPAAERDALDVTSAPTERRRWWQRG